MTEAPPRPCLEAPGNSVWQEMLRRCRGESACPYARTVAMVEDLLASSVRMDPRTGITAADLLGAILQRMLQHAEAGCDPEPLDTVLRAAELSHDALEAILARPTARLARKHRRLPLHKLREQDASTFAWLCRQPGRNAKEKTAMTRSPIGVTREQSNDLPENRFVKRLCLELASSTSARVETRRSGDPNAGHASNEARGQRLADVQRLATIGLQSSPLGTLPPAIRPRPNNVLLSDAHYGKLWRAWLMLQAQEDALARAWRHCASRFAELVASLTLARLASLGGAVLLDLPCTPDLDSDTEPVFGPALGTPVLLPLPTGDAILVTLGLTGESCEVTADMASLRGPGIPSPCARGQLRLHIAFGWDATCDCNQSFPVTARVVGAGKGDGESLFGFADLGGILALADWFVSIVLREPLERGNDWIAPTRRVPEPLSEQSWARASCEMACGTIELCSDDGSGGRTAVRFPSVAAVREVEGARLWYAGLDARHLCDDGGQGPCRTTAHDSWEALASGEDTALHGLHEILVSAVHSAGPARVGAHLAMLVPDDIPEPGLSKLRGVVPASVGTTWFLPRSVAAALALRALSPSGGASFELSKDDELLVIDGDAPALTVTCLAARWEPTAIGDGWYWERSAPFDKVEGAEGASLRGLLLGIARLSRGETPKEMGDAVERAIERCVDEGMLRSDTARDDIWIPLDTAGGPKVRWLMLRVTEDARQAAEIRQVKKLVACLELLRKGENWSVWTQGGRGRGVMLVGSLFRNDRVRAPIADWFARNCPHLKVLGVDQPEMLTRDGGMVFLQRHLSNLPTYREMLPDLFLEFGTQEGSQKLEIFSARSVKPGEVISQVTRVTLPAGQRTYELPMWTTRGQSQLPYVARIELQSPFKTTVTAELRVRFRYAEDAFQIALAPISDRSIGELSVTWDRRATGRTTVVVDDSPPTFLEPKPWSTQAVQRFRRECEVAADFFRSALNQEVKRARDDTASERQQLARNHGQMQETLKRLRNAARQVWSPGTLATGAPEELVQCLTLVVPVLGELAKVATQMKGKALGLEGNWLQRLARFRGDQQKFQRDALLTLGAFGMHAPPTTAERALQGIATAKAPALKKDPELAKVVGRTAGFAAADKRARILHSLCDSVDQRFDASWVKELLWAISTILWSREEVVLELEGVQADALLAMCVRVLERLSDGWRNSNCADDVYIETYIILVALLRLRGTPLGARVAADCDEMRGMAEIVRKADCAIRKQMQRRGESGVRWRSCRLQLKKDEVVRDDISPFGDQLIAFLRGERVALVSALRESEEP